MSLVAREVLDICRHALYHGDLSAEIDGYGALNRAGDALTSCHSWGWLARPAATIPLVSGQSYAEWPSDFAEMIGYQGSSTFNTTLSLVTLQRLAEMRSTTTSVAGFAYHGAIVYAPQDGDTPPTPRLDLWPTPSADVADAFTVFYRAGWTELSEPDDPIALPLWMEQLYIEFALAHVLGLEMPEEGNVSQRVAQVLTSPTMVDAKRRDGRIQPFFGIMRGGAIEQQRAGEGRWHNTATSVTVL